MFDYDGAMDASLDDYRGLVAKVIEETFPNSRCIVRIRQTKAMAFPLLSISIDEGPSWTDLPKSIPLLALAGRGARWAYCGKVLPALGYSVLQKPGGVLAKMSHEIFDQLRREAPHTFFCAKTGRLNPKSAAIWKGQLSVRAEQAHPVESSPTMELIQQGRTGNIVQIAMEQRREDLKRATPQAKTIPQTGLRASSGAKRL